MEPTLPPDCEITIVPVVDDLPLGSLIVFAGRDSALVVHRLVRRTNRYLVAQGDARLWPDPRLDPAQVLGRVIAAETASRRIWPGRFEGLVSWFWVSRAAGLWFARRVHARVRRLLARQHLA